MKRLHLTFVNQNCVYVAGYGSRELLTELRHRPPVWSSLGRAWTCQPRTAHDLIAEAERQGFEVTITEDDPLPAARGTLW